MSNRTFHISGSIGVVLETSDLRNLMESSPKIPKIKVEFPEKPKTDNPTLTVELPFGIAEMGNTMKGENLLFLQGIDNQFPSKLKKILAKSPIYKVGLKYSAQQLAGMGLQTGKESIDEETGEEVFKNSLSPGWKDYAKRANFFNNFYARGCRNLKTWNMVYVLVSMSEQNLIANTTVLPNDRCRLWGNTKTGTVSHCIVADWERITSQVNPNNAQFYPVIDAWYNTAESFRETVKANPTVKEYVYVLRVPSDDIVYNIPDHFTLVESGLLDYANNIVNFKKWVQQNLTTLDKILFVSDEYMEGQYPQWQSWKSAAENGGKKGDESADKISAAYDAVVEAFQKSASGIQKGGKTITAPMNEDGKKSIEIVKVEQNSFDAQYNIDAGWVEKQIHWALQIDAGLYSSVEGKNNNGGSAKTQTFNIAQANEWIYEQSLIQIPQFISDFNGYGVETFRVRRATMYSTDALSAKDRSVQNPMNN